MVYNAFNMRSIKFIYARLQLEKKKVYVQCTYNVNLILISQPNFIKATMKASKLHLKSIQFHTDMYSQIYILTPVSGKKIILPFICSSTFGVMEISVTMTQMSLGIAAKSLFQRPCGRWDAFAENTKHKNHGKKLNTSECFFFSNVEHLPLSLFFFFYTLCISSLLPKDFVSYHFLFFFFLKQEGYR